MSQQEMLQVVNLETGEPTGEHVSRKELYEKGLWCRTTNIFVLNTQGQILCHQRSLGKERNPGAWSTHFGGHVTQGESFKISALKELGEEIGLNVNPFQLIPWRTSKIKSARVWVRDFITVFDGDILTLTPQEGEVEQVQWYYPEEIMDLLDAEDITNDNTTQWVAGTHDFNAEYQCMRAVLTATMDIGIFGGDYKPLHKWHPPRLKD